MMKNKNMKRYLCITATGMITELIFMGLAWCYTTAPIGVVVAISFIGLFLGIGAGYLYFDVKKYMEIKRRDSKKIPKYEIRRKDVPMGKDVYSKNGMHFVGDELIYSEIRRAIELKHSMDEIEQIEGRAILRAIENMGLKSPQ